ncbi:MAG: NAD(P)/FAD-dependent oxidoreductase [Verrucomicrobiota bacterium]
MKKIVIIGAGFAGLEAARVFASSRPKTEVTLIDRETTSDFLPLLPDVIGGRMAVSAIQYPISPFCVSRGIRFVNSEVKDVDVNGNRVVCAQEHIPYDYLLVASGSDTNFFGDSAMSSGSFKLDNSKDAAVIDERLSSGDFKNCIVAGGGYTGIEIATHIRQRFRNSSSQPRIIIVELSSQILGNVPGWMRSYAAANLDSMNIEPLTGTKIESIEGSNLTLSDGSAFSSAVPIWSAGVKVEGFPGNIEKDRAAQGRLPVGSDLCVKDNIFAAGDVAGFMYRGEPLRMAVQFSIIQGRHAAKNILRNMQGLPMKAYRPLDLGFIVPMANWRSCGFVFNARVRGRLCSLLHYLLCVYRSQSLPLKGQVLRRLAWGSGKERISNG